MKICHMTSAHDSDDIRILKKQCVSLAKYDDNEVYLVARGDSFLYKKVRVIGVGTFNGGRISRILKFSRIIYNKALEINADVYELHDPELLLYARRLKKRGKKVIFDSHENYQKQITNKEYIPFLIRKIIKWIYLVIENKACQFLDAVLYPEDNNPYDGRVANCVTITNSPMREEFEVNTPFADKKECVCCVGTLSESRGIRKLIKACYKTGVKLVLGGSFVSKDFENSLKSEQAFSIVEYRGICSREEVNRIYNECLIGADTILWVGQYPFSNCLSTKVYEYMIMGMPFITSDFAYNRKIIDEYKCGIYVDPSDENAIAEAISFLIKNKDKARQMGQNGKRFVNKNFNWALDERRLIDLYERIYNN